MLLTKTGFPEENDLVFCTVTNVQYNSVFVKIEEYEKQGLIHISEISPGRIRNIRDFVTEGKMIVCKVIKVDEQKGYIDLSLRRVTEIQRRQKTDERKQEQKAEKIIDMLAHQLKIPTEKLYDEIAPNLIAKYGLVQYAFEEVVEKGTSLESMGVPAKYAKQLEVIVKDKIKPKEVVIGGTMTIKSYAENGVQNVKDALVAAEKAGQGIEVRYLGAGAYSTEVKAKAYKEAEKALQAAIDAAETSIRKDKTSEFLFKKKEKKD